MCELPDVRVVSVSYSGAESQSRRDAATYCKEHGALMVTAAGNDSRDLTVFGEADEDDLIVVGASTANDAKSGFSAFGSYVDVWAPGSSVWTTTLGGRYTAVSGTSFSCPIAAGLIALIWSTNPQLSPNQVETILKTSTDNVGLRDSWNTQYGRVNSYKALMSAGTGTFSVSRALTILYSLISFRILRKRTAYPDEGFLTTRNAIILFTITSLLAHQQSDDPFSDWRGNRSLF